MDIDRTRAIVGDLSAPGRRERLRREFGHPEPYPDAADALRRLGVRDRVHPFTVRAYLYPSEEAAEAYAMSNMEHHGHPTLLTDDQGQRVFVDGKVLAAVELGPSRQGVEQVDPGLPDDYAPPAAQEPTGELDD